MLPNLYNYSCVKNYVVQHCPEDLADIKHFVPLKTFSWNKTTHETHFVPGKRFKLHQYAGERPNPPGHAQESVCFRS